MSAPFWFTVPPTTAASCGFLYRYQFAGNHRLVNEAAAFGHFANQPGIPLAGGPHTGESAQPRRQGYPRCGPRVTCATRACSHQTFNRFGSPPFALASRKRPSRISATITARRPRNRRLPNPSRQLSGRGRSPPGSGRMRCGFLTGDRQVYDRAPDAPAPGTFKVKTATEGSSAPTGSVQITSTSFVCRPIVFITHSCIPGMGGHFKR